MQHTTLRRLSAFAMAMILSLSIVAFNPAAVLAGGEITVTIDGVPVVFEDQGPVIVQDRTLVPVRDVFEALGFEVDWNAADQQAELVRDDYVIIIPIGSSTFTTNGVSYPLDVPAQIINNRTLLPLRLVLESAGYELDWDGSTRTVIITSPGTDPPEPTPAPTPAPPTPTPAPAADFYTVGSSEGFYTWVWFGQPVATIVWDDDEDALLITQGSNNWEMALVDIQNVLAEGGPGIYRAEARFKIASANRPYGMAFIGLGSPNPEVGQAIEGERVPINNTEYVLVTAIFDLTDWSGDVDDLMIIAMDNSVEPTIPDGWSRPAMVPISFQVAEYRPEGGPSRSLSFFIRDIQFYKMP